jgi:catechol 2,3-dioxygenase-like lactoylglutathione lyase family enzyme
MYTHIGINVTNLEKSIEFYGKLFGVGPVKVRADYAKFLVEDPALNFTLNVRSEVSGNQINHFGLQVSNTNDLLQHKMRLEEAGLDTLEEMNTTCCYSVQDKFWVHDPDGHNWEFFFPKQDSDSRYGTNTDDASTCCVPQREEVTATTGGCCAKEQEGKSHV